MKLDRPSVTADGPALRAYAKALHPRDAQAQAVWAEQAKTLLYEHGGTALLEHLLLDASGISERRAHQAAERLMADRIIEDVPVRVGIGSGAKRPVRGVRRVQVPN